MNKKFLTIREGVELYSMGHENFRKMAEEARAVYKINRKILVNAVAFDLLGRALSFIGVFAILIFCLSLLVIVFKGLWHTC